MRGFRVRRKLKAVVAAARYVDDDDFDYCGVDEDFLPAMAELGPGTPRTASPLPRPPPVAAARPAPSSLWPAAPSASTPAANGARSASREPPPTAAAPLPVVAAARQRDARTLAPKGTNGAATAAAAAAGGTDVTGLAPRVGEGVNIAVVPSEKVADASEKVSSEVEEGALSPAESGRSAAETFGRDGSRPTGDRSPQRSARHVAEVERLMSEWGFKDWATAEAFLKARQRQMRGQTNAHLRQRMQVCLEPLTPEQLNCVHCSLEAVKFTTPPPNIPPTSPTPKPLQDCSFMFWNLWAGGSMEELWNQIGDISGLPLQHRKLTRFCQISPRLLVQCQCSRDA